MSKTTDADVITAMAWVNAITKLVNDRDRMIVALTEIAAMPPEPPPHAQAHTMRGIALRALRGDEE